MKIRPLRDMVVVRQLAAPPYAGKVVLVEGQPQLSQHGEIVAVGPEVRDAKVGARVVFSRLQGTQVDLGEPLVLLQESGILAREDK